MKPFRFIFSPVFMTILFFLFVLSMATATFIGNDFGHETAYETVYNTKWFELIMLLLALNLAGQIFQHRLWRKEKITVMGFHMAFVIMFAGAGITRYNGYEGTMRIKEGEEENRVFSAEKYISYILKDKEGKILSQQYKKFSPASFSRVKYEWKVDGSLILRLAQIIPNAIESIEGSPSGSPVISFMISYPGHGIKNLVMKEGDTATVEGYSICFVPGIKSDISIMADSTGFYLITSLNAFAGGMMQEEKTAYQPGERILLSKMQVINIGNIRIVPRDFMLKGIITPIPADEEAAETGRNAFTFQIFEQDKTYMLTLWDNPEDYYSSLPLEINGKTLEVSYGSRIINLPFSIKLNDFILERYPGSNTPSAYKSDIVLNDYNDGVSKQFLIYMNNVLKYKGYRFYQASYESDEKGTILSVNHDMAGIMVTYTGYSILFIFIILSLLNRNSLFRKANINYWHSPFSKKLSSLAILFVLSGFTGVMAQKQQFIPDKDVADEFGHVLVQNQKGRTEPLYTISSDILRKVTRKNRFGGLTSMQVFLGIYFDFQNWQNIPLIRISSRKLSEKIGINGRMAAFSDIVDFNRNGYYKLAGYVETAYSKRPAERSKFDREVIKTDERINIIYMIY
ncbi:MAG: cytochrome c biogenesis protein ResB, partial [Bacteroidales bacterium]